MIEIKVDVDKIEYADVIERLLPEILPRISQGKSNLTQRLLQELEGKPGEMALKAIRFLPKSIQDEIALNLLMTYKKELINLFEKFATEKSLSISISDILFSIKDTVEYG